MAKKTAASNEGFATLKSDLRQKTPGRCYVFHGEENYLKEYYLRSLKKQLLDDLTEQFNFHRLTAENFSMEELTDSVEAYPMMSERSLIQVDEVNLFKLPDAERDRLAAMLSDLPEHCCLVFYYDAVPFQPDKRLKKLWTALSKAATIVDFQKQGERELADWVARHFLSAKKQITPDLCRYLVVRTGGSMSLLQSEIEKLCAYVESVQISKTDIDTVVEPVLDAVAFDISNAVSAGDYPSALRKLRTLLQKQEEPIVILAALGTQIRRLNAARILRNQGKGADSLMNLYSMGEYPARITMQQAQRLSDEFCAQAVLLCLQTDERLKTSYDEPERLLELLLLRLAQEAKR